MPNPIESEHQEKPSSAISQKNTMLRWGLTALGLLLPTLGIALWKTAEQEAAQTKDVGATEEIPGGIAPSQEAIAITPFSPPTIQAITTPEATVIATATATASPTAKSAEAQPTPTAVATPEAAKVVYWTEAQILQAQEEAATKGQVLLLDTWTVVGGRVKEFKTITGATILTLEGFKKGNKFKSPISKGKVTSISVIAAGKPTSGNILGRVIEVTTRKGETKGFYFPPDDTVLVKLNQEVNLDTDYVEFSGERFPPGLGLPGQAAIGSIPTKDEVPELTLKDILRDQNGLPVGLKH